MSATVTLEKSYFETLLRKAQFHTSGADFTTPIDVPTVTIPKSDHDSLLVSSREYANLKRNLYRGGIAEETLEILVKDDALKNGTSSSMAYSAVDERSDGGLLTTQFPLSMTPSAARGQDYTYGRNANYSHSTPHTSEYRPRGTNSYHNHSSAQDEHTHQASDGFEDFHDEESGEKDSQSRFRSQRPQYDKFCKRTVLLTNLPENVTHTDVVSVVKGGMLLDIFLRTHDKAASVSFLHESSAEEYFRYVKRCNIYIRGKRIDIRWGERQFILPGHVANKVASGATRNLVIVNRSAKHTEEAIRDDLEHIHNLVVIKITFSGQNAHIQTNSVHNSMFARTCMMSRATYKGSKIEWDLDECNAPLEQPTQVRSFNPPVKKKDPPVVNRFHLLRMEDSEDESQDDADKFDSTKASFQSIVRHSTAALVA